MMMDIIRLKGIYVLRAWKNSLLVCEKKVPNLITTLGKGLVCDNLISVVTSGLHYHAIGTGTTAAAIADIKLETEVTRKEVTSRTRVGNVITLSTFYLAAQATYNIKEVGIFGGGATAAADSGTLFSHALLSYDNSAGLYDLTFDYELTIS